jgi:hypothetical protein
MYFSFSGCVGSTWFGNVIISLLGYIVLSRNNMFPFVKVFQMRISKSVVLSIGEQVDIFTAGSNFLAPISSWGHVFGDEVLSCGINVISLILSAFETSLLQIPFKYFYCCITLISNRFLEGSFNGRYFRFVSTVKQRQRISVIVANQVVRTSGAHIWLLAFSGRKCLFVLFNHLM